MESSLSDGADQARNRPSACSGPARSAAVPQARFDPDAKVRNGQAHFDADAKTRNAGTADAGYARRLQRLEGARWKQMLRAQAPYRWNIRRLNLGFTLDVGCGIGRNLRYLDGNGVGVDHNATSVGVAREAGLTAFTPEEFLASPHARPGGFDSMLLAHVLEHLAEDEVRGFVGGYLPYIRSGGSVVFITPQERGYASDATHVRFVGFTESTALAVEFGLTVARRYSFPLPRIAGRAFVYNEFVVVSRKS
jgi:2-polyprenyl-3-methyl-5-hydroxy-6-metoxy-1,4-benzoquinol methylase